MLAPMPPRPSAKDDSKLLELSTNLAASRISSIRLFVKDADKASHMDGALAGAGSGKTGMPAQHSATVASSQPLSDTRPLIDSVEAVKQGEVKRRPSIAEPRHFVPEHIRAQRGGPLHASASTLHIPMNTVRSAKQRMADMKSLREPRANPAPHTPVMSREGLRKSAAALNSDAYADALKLKRLKVEPSESTPTSPAPPQRDALKTVPKATADSGPELAAKRELPSASATGASGGRRVSAPQWQLLRAALIAILLAVVSCLGVGAICDWHVKAEMSARRFALNSDMRPWMKTYNRLITQELARLRLDSAIPTP